MGGGVARGTQSRAPTQAHARKKSELNCVLWPPDYNIVMDSQREKYIAATRGLVDILKRETEYARQRFSQLGGLQVSQMMSNIVAEGAHIFRPTVTGYLKWLETVGVSTRKEMEELKKSFGDDKDVLKCWEELLAAETQFVELGAKFNKVVQEEEDKVSKLNSITRIIVGV